MLPTRELLAGASHPEALSQVLQLADVCVRTFQPQWSGFLGAPEREECFARLAPLVELKLSSSGGFPKQNANACCLNAVKLTLRKAQRQHR